LVERIRDIRSGREWGILVGSRYAGGIGISVENGRMEAGILVGGHGIVGERGTRPD